MPSKSTQEPGNIYTNAPVLPRSLILGSVRLLFWLFFHPAACRHHLARIDANLRADFCLIELTAYQWRRAAFWQLLLMFFLAWPVLLAFVLGGTLWLLGLSTASIVTGITLGVTLGLVCHLVVSLAGSLAIGTAVGMAIALVGGLAAGILLEPASGSALFSGFGRLPGPDLMLSAVLGVAGGLAGGLAYGVALGLAGAGDTPGSTTSLARQISGMVIGLFLGIGGGVIAGLVQVGVLTGLVLGAPLAVAVYGRTHSWRRALASGLLVGIAGFFVQGLGEPGGLDARFGLLGLLALLIALFTLPYVLAERIAGPWAGALAGSLGSVAGLYLYLVPGQSPWSLLLFSLFGILLGLTLAWWRPILSYPFLLAYNRLLLRLDERRLPATTQHSVLRRHSAFWDELQRLPLVGLDDHLLLVLTHRPAEGELALAYLATSRQRWAAQAAQTELDARRLATCASTADIAAAHHQLTAGELAGDGSALLRSFSRLSRDVAAARQQESAYNQRLALSAVEDRLDGLLRELTRSHDEQAARFRPLAEQWRRLVANDVQRLAAEAELRQEIDSPYIIGVPLTDRQEIFVGRADISSRIEQLLLDRRQPPLLLYGQRRVGKTSLLNNLGRLLPSTILPLFIDLQGPATLAQDDAGFLYNVARSMIRSARRQRDFALPPLPREALAADPYTRFDEWLEAVEDNLTGQLALLMLDEFEVLATAVANKRFNPEAVLGMLRHLIQHRPRFKVLLSGSHTLGEFQRWASYLINVQVIHIGYLQTAEARQLVEAPVDDFALQYDPAASQQILDLTRGHPFLVQLLCAEVVALKNEQPPAQRRLASVADVETAVAPALAHGSFFFADIEQNQVDDTGRAVLRFLAAQPQPVVARQALVDYVPSLKTLEETLAALQQREIVEQAEGGYRFQVPLVRRWFGER